MNSGRLRRRPEIPALTRLRYLLRSQKRTELHGIVHEGYQPCVRVLKPSEERGLRRIG